MPVHDYDTSEGESGADTLSTQRIYTPTSSTDMNTSSTVSADEGLEHTPLLSDHDEYDSSYVGEKTPPSIDSEAGEVGGLKEAKEPLLPTPDARAAPHDRCRRRRCRRVCLLVSVKVILLVGSLGWLTWFFGIVSWPKSKHICHCNHPGHDFDFDTAPNRVITIDNGPDPIHGTFPLYDQLALSTTSGNIGVIVHPQAADADNPDEPARLRIRTQSGSVSVSFAAPETAGLPADELALELTELKQTKDEIMRQWVGQRSSRKKKCKKGCKRWDKKNKNKGEGDNVHHHRTHLPPRPYTVDIETNSGSISGRFLFSASARLVSHTGSITATLIPIAYGGEYHRGSGDLSLHTHSRTGSQQVRLTGPIFIGRSSRSGSGSVDRNAEADTAPIATASHITKAGSMHITYPRQWAGTVHGESRTGAMLLRGRGLCVTKGEGWVEGVKEAERGCRRWAGGNMNVSLVATGGSVVFYVG